MRLVAPVDTGPLLESFWIETRRLLDMDDKPKKRALGKGLGALIPNTSEAPATRKDFLLCDVNLIDPGPGQPRRHFDEAALQELAQSIRESGLVQPLVARLEGERYQLIAGERRLRASKLAGLKEVPLVVREISDKDAFVLALVENIQRQDLNPIEEASAFARLIEDHGLTQQETAERVGKSRSAVANAVRLLALPPTIRDYLIQGLLTPGHAKILVTLPEEEAEELADIIVRHEYSVREAEELVRQSKSAPKEKVQVKHRDDTLVRDVVSRLQSALGTKVKIKDRNGKGRIEIHYANLEVLQSVLDRLIDEDEI